MAYPLQKYFLRLIIYGKLGKNTVNVFMSSQHFFSFFLVKLIQTGSQDIGINENLRHGRLPRDSIAGPLNCRWHDP